MTKQTIHTSLLSSCSLPLDDLERVCGGAGGMPLSGDVTQQINTNWGGTQIINPAPPPVSPYRFEQLRQNPQLRFGPPPYKPMPRR
ncbi:MAG TPA: hypothetical protein VFQ53_20755 [Kofleriaceae bacterium]|nr:hypothetical protein [Kofleriaceae bacterium]